MEAHAHKNPGYITEGRGLAHVYCVISGAVLVLLGVGGMFVNADFSTGNSITANTFIVFDVNGWLNVINILLGGAALIVGAVALALPSEHDNTRRFTLGMGIFLIVVAAWSLLSVPVLGMLPMSSTDTILYAGIGTLGLMTGLGPDESEV